MQRKHYQIEIKAPVENVFDAMLGLSNKGTYEQWTSIFNPSSTFEGRWEKGSKIYFLGFDDQGKRGGMIARIEAHIPNQFVSIQHYGMLDGDHEIVDGPEVENWAGGFENYTFESKDDHVVVKVEVDVTDDHLEYFDTTYPKALEKLKEVVESKTD